MIAATPPGLLSGVSAGITGSVSTGYTLTVNDTAYLGTLVVVVTVSDGALSTTQTFQVTFTDTAPTLTTTSALTQSVNHTQQATASLSGSGTTGATLTLSAQVEGYSSLFNLEQQYDFQAPPGAANYYFNARDGQEKYLYSAALGGYYFIVPGGDLYSWNNNAQGSLSMSETTATFIADLGSAAYSDPTLLTNAMPPYNSVAHDTEQTLELHAPAPNNYYFNAGGKGEEYLVSTTSNLANGGYYILMPTGNLYAWDGHSLNSSLAAPPVDTLPTYYYQNPAYLIAASSVSPITAVTAAISAGVLTVTDSTTTPYIGTVTIEVTESDGALTATLSFTITFTTS